MSFTFRLGSRNVRNGFLRRNVGESSRSVRRQRSLLEPSGINTFPALGNAVGIHNCSRIGRYFSSHPLSAWRHNALPVIDGAETPAALDSAGRQGACPLQRRHRNYGEGLFQLAPENHLDGIVAMRKFSPYLPNRGAGSKSVIRITRNGKNARNSSSEGRESDPVG